MDILLQLVSNLTKEELRFFKLYASRLNDSKDRKDLELLDFIRKSGSEYEEDKILKLLYGTAGKNAFYRLKNRLTQDLSKSLVLQHFDDEEFNNTLYFISLSKLFYRRSQFKLSFYFLRKAERQAKALEFYELLEIIYGDYIRLSYELLTIDPAYYIELRKENSSQLFNLRQIDDVLSVVSYRLKVTQNFSPKENNVLDLLEKTISNFAQDEELKKSPTFRIRIYQAVSRILLQRHDYPNLEVYLLKTYQEFTSDSLFNKSNHEIKLQMLTYLANTLSKTGQSEKSLQFAEKLKVAMDEFGRLYYEKYLFFYYNSLVINYFKIDLDKGIDLLEQMGQNDNLKSPFYEQFIYLNLGIFYFEKGNFRQSARNITKLYQLPDFANADVNLQFRVAIAELIVRFEIQDFEFLERRIDQVKKEFKPQLSEPNFESETKMVELLRQMTKPGFKKNKKLMNIVEWFRSNRSELENEEQLINFNDWINSRFKNN
jgi:tetratricopeptide (TPR) repeat protein